MFIESWRKHWGLTQDPFSCEDADKDVILSRMHSEAVHSVFDRLYGDPTSPAPGIVFGEKGSGKSGLRLTMRRKLAAAREAGTRVLCSEYMDFDGYLERFRRSVGAKPEPAAVGRAVRENWTLSDHLDAMLSCGVTGLVDELLESDEACSQLSSKQKADLLLLIAFHYDSHQHTTVDAVRRLRTRLRVGSARSGMTTFLRVLLSFAGMAALLLPFFAPSMDLPDLGPDMAWHIGGAVLLVGVWLQALYSKAVLASAARSVKNIRVLGRDPKVVADVLRVLDPATRKEFTLPQGTDEATRYDHVGRFTSILQTLGYSSWYVLFDRIDEPSALNADAEGAHRFVETILDHKLLQVPGLALKLFLPIELDGIYRNASPEELKRMRLDKSNLVPTLNWTGQELIEIATQRLSAVAGGNSVSFADFFADDLDIGYVRETLQTLGTPRYSLGFLTAVFLEYARNLPGDLDEGAPEWRVPRSHFDVVRASWIEQANLLRRKLN